MKSTPGFMLMFSTSPAVSPRPLTFRPIHQLDLLLVCILLGTVGAINIGGKTPNLFWTDLILPFLVIYWVACGRRLRLTGVETWFAMHLVVVLVSLVQAVDLPRSLAIAKLHFTPLVVFLLMADAVRSRQDVRHALRSIILFGCVLSLMVLYNWRLFSLGLRYAEFEGVKEWAQVSWGRSNLLAGLLILVIPLVAAILGGKGRLWSLAAIAAFGLMGVVLVLSLSRGAMLSLLLATLLWLCLELILTRQRGWETLRLLFWMFVIVVGVGFAVWFFLPESLKMTLGTTFQFLGAQAQGDAPTNERILKLEEAWRYISVQPFTGIGTGNQDSLVFAGGSAHNFIAESLLENGIAGALPLFIALGLCARSVFRVWRNGTGSDHILGAAIFVAFWAGIFHNLVEPNFWAGPFTNLFWPMLALTFGINRLRVQENKVADPGFSPGETPRGQCI